MCSISSSLLLCRREVLGATVSKSDSSPKAGSTPCCGGTKERINVSGFLQNSPFCLQTETSELLGVALNIEIRCL